MDDKRSNFEKLSQAFDLSKEIERPSNLAPSEPEPTPKPHREVRPPVPKPPKVEPPATKGKVIYWTTRARADQIRALKHLIANLQLKDDERTMTQLTIEALDLLLEKYKDV
jgi:hypothetical protein